MKFSERLAHLAPPVRAAVTAASPQVPAVQPMDVDPLAHVRAKLAELTGAQRSRQATDSERRRTGSNEAPNTFDQLPFVRVETERGPLFQSTRRLRLSERVGRYSLNDARDADPELLSLLALDPSLASCRPSGALYFDTETTGLGGAGTLAFLVGLSFQAEDGCWVMEQLLLRHPSEEAALLFRIRELVEAATLLVSFNGRSFDWPLLQARHVMNQLDLLPVRPHLDLLHVARRVHKRRLSRCRLIDLETEILGFMRGEDDIPGIEIPPRYGHFLRTGDEEALRAVVDHNVWDVMTMVALVGLYGRPFSTEHLDDLCSSAETLIRAKDFDRAEDLAQRVMDQGENQTGLLIRAKARKARGDIALALSDFEQLSRDLDDPQVRLILAKMYEHHVRDFDRALAWVEQGTGEGEHAEARREARLKRKAIRSREG